MSDPKFIISNQKEESICSSVDCNNMLVLGVVFSEICPEEMEKLSVTLTSDHMENSPVYIDDPKNMDIELSNPISSAAPVMVEVSVKEQNTSAVEFYTVTTEVENAANVKWTLMSEDGTPIETIKVRSEIKYRTQPNKHTVTFPKFYILFLNQ